MSKKDIRISTYLETIKDPRHHNTRHKPNDILIIAICAIICGAETWTQVQEYGNVKRQWLSRFLELPSGIPSHDTFGRVFSMLDPEQLREAFNRWSRQLRKHFGASVVAIDGKTLRRSHDNANDKSAIHVVSAWDLENSIVLGQVKTDEKSNEITAIPELISALEIKGAIVTIDAMGCQTKIARKIMEKDGDYVIALKGNQSSLHDNVRFFFQNEPSPGPQFESIDGGHGRIETRRYRLCSDIAWLQGKENWPGLKTIVEVERHRDIGGNVSSETSYYISSVEISAEKMASAIRGHWGIENSLHWTLDVSFREDQCRVRKNHAPENMAILRHIAVNLLKRDKTFKGGITAKRLKAGWDTDYLIAIFKI